MGRNLCRCAGSVLGPLPFLIYINDRTENLCSDRKYFADDTSLLTTVQDGDTAATELDHDFEIIRLWAHKWMMSFNPDPRKNAVELIVSTKETKTEHPPIILNGALVINVDQHRHLCVILDCKLLFPLI